MLPSRPKLKTNRGSILYPTRTGVSFRKLHRITAKAAADRDLKILPYSRTEEKLTEPAVSDKKGDKE